MFMHRAVILCLSQRLSGSCQCLAFECRDFLAGKGKRIEQQYYRLSSGKFLM